MRIFSDINSLSEHLLDAGEYCAVLIGKFDGVHAGHRRLIRSAVEAGKEEGLKTLLVTFDRPLGSYFSREAVKVLLTNEEKEAELQALGLSYEFILPVNASTMDMAPEDFLSMLSGKLRARLISAGRDVSFGKGGAGDEELLRKLSGVLGYKPVFVDKELYEGEAISSSRIRDALTEGRMEDAEAMLSYPWYLRGRVVRGAALGRKIGFPTANVPFQQEKVMPPYGVYFSEILAGGRTYPGVTNLGVKPTVSDDGEVMAESVLLGFDGDLYGREIQIRLKHFERPEQKFEGIDALKARISRDLKEAAVYFGEGNL